MRLLFESGNADELENKRSLLESRGIPVFISGTESFRLRPLLVGYKKGFWVLIDEQYDDARALLKDKNHKIAMPVDPEAFHREFEQVQQEPLSMVFGGGEAFLNQLAIIAALLFGAWIAWAIISASQETPLK